MTKILVVDDEEGILDLLDDYLTEHGFDVVSATDGAAAISQVYKERPDVVLLDLNIPEANGYEVLRELREEPTTKNLPVVMLTGVSPEEGEQTAVELGVNHYLSKPWTQSSLKSVIRVALREVGGSGWARPSTSHLQNVNRFSVDGPVAAGGWRITDFNSLNAGAAARS